MQEMLLRDGQQFGPRGVNIPELDLEISPMELYTSTLNLYRRTMADESLLLELAERCVPQLIKKGLFTQEEVTEDNKILIARAFGEMEITLHDILRKKEEGDFLAEAHTLGPLLSSAAAPVASESAGSTIAVAASTPAVLYSQAMEKYIQDKLDDGRWKEHSLPDHKNRLNAFLEIMGDMPVNSITDEEMREFRNTLRRLPANGLPQKRPYPFHKNSSNIQSGKFEALHELVHAALLEKQLEHYSVAAVGEVGDHF